MGNNLILEKISKQNRQVQIIDKFWKKSNCTGKPYKLQKQIVRLQTADLILPIISPKKPSRQQIQQSQQKQDFDFMQKYDYPLGQLQFVFQNQRNFGIGVFIGSSYIITTASCIINKKSKKRANQIFCYFGCAKLKIVQMFIPVQFQRFVQFEINSEQFDYAVLSLQNFFEKERLGYVGIDTRWNSFEDQIITFRRSNNLQKRVKAKIIQKVKQNKIIEFQQNFFIFQTKSQLPKGSPILKRSQKDERTYHLVGFYLNTNNKTNFETALRINEKIRNQINQWLSPKMWKLNLNQFQLQNENLNQVIEKKWNHINFIDLSYNDIGPQGISVLMNQQYQCLKILNLNQNHIKAEGVKYIASTKLWQLQQFYLNYNQVRNQGLKNLLQYSWPSLKILQLKGNCIKNQGVNNLVEKQGMWKQLRQLNLAQNVIGNLGVKNLINFEWISLEKIILDQNIIENQGAQYIAKINIKSLKLIYLNGNKIGNQGVQHLYSSSKLKGKQIYVSKNYISNQIKQAFAIKLNQKAKIIGIQNQYQKNPHFDVI